MTSERATAVKATEQGNDKARCVLRSWCRSAGLDVGPVEPGTHLVVQGKRIAVARRHDSKADLTVSAVALASLDFDEAFLEVKKVFAFLNRRPPNLVRVPNGRKRVASNDFLGKLLRVTMFEKCPDPHPDDWRWVQPIVRREAIFASRSTGPYKDQGFERLRVLMDESDWESLGMTYAVVFLHNYQNLISQADNARFFRHFVQGKFREAAELARETVPNLRNFCVEDVMSVPENVGTDFAPQYEQVGHEDLTTHHEPSFVPAYAGASWQEVSPEPDDDGPAIIPPKFPNAEAREKYLKRQRRIECDFNRKMRLANEARLQARLPEPQPPKEESGPVHDRWVGAMSDVAANPALDYETRLAAAERIKGHYDWCETCLTAYHAHLDRISGFRDVKKWTSRKVTPDHIMGIR